MEIIADWKTTFEKHLTTINWLLSANRNLYSAFESHRIDKFDIGFNIFKITSDLYFRENFHSDILKSLLDPQEKHRQLYKYLHLFIELVNTLNRNISIDKKNYNQTIVQREKHNIDILIADEASKRAIIIENKINNAVDQPRQIPKYFDKVKEKYKVDAIVYLTLDSSKKPNKFDWTEQEKNTLSPLITIIPSYDRFKPNLYDGWIIPSLVESNDLESMFLLKQYGNLIKYLNANNMDVVSLEKFYEIIKENDNLKSSISIKNMLNDLPEYLAIRIEDRYKDLCYPFQKVWRYQKNDTVFEAFELDKLYLKMDIWCSEHGYKIYFWNPKDEEYDIKKNLENLDFLSTFNYDGNKKNNVVMTLSFYEEHLLFDLIDKVKNQLKSLKK